MRLNNTRPFLQNSFPRVLAAFADYVRGETLSLELIEGEPPADAHRSDQDVDGHAMTLAVRKA